jgi:hypothetical protein
MTLVHMIKSLILYIVHKSTILLFWYPTTSLHRVATQKTITLVHPIKTLILYTVSKLLCLFMGNYSARYPTTSLHSVIAQKTMTLVHMIKSVILFTVCKLLCPYPWTIILLYTYVEPLVHITSNGMFLLITCHNNHTN